MKLVTWNVNSIKVRRDRLLRLLAARQPDVVCLQELKSVESALPVASIRELGYHMVAIGQQTYNGVAILSRSEPRDVVAGLEGDDGDEQARFIAATIDGLRVISVYVPNGQAMGSDKYAYKIAWLRRLRAYLERYHSPKTPLVVAGDFNVALTPDDCSSPSEWQGGVLYNPEIIGVLEEVLGWGLTDLFRLHNEGPGHLSWWDYRQAAFERDEGMRIDYLFGTEPVAERVVASFIDRDERVEVEGDKPSDHAPVVVSLDWQPPATVAPSGASTQGSLF